jgi:probable F420-dependent oxidoreductase
MKFGAVLPQLEIDAQDIRLYLTEVEAMGFDYLVAFDHVVGVSRDIIGSGRYALDDQFHEVLTLFAYAAAITQKLEFSTSVLILPERQAALVAKQAAQIDVFSNGRLRLGIGIGWNQIEMQALGQAFKNRARRIEEQIAVMRALWTQEEVTFNGKYHTLNRVGLNPMPVQRPIPIWFGGSADGALERMARLGDGWMPNPGSPDEVREHVTKLHGYLEANGRDPKTFGLDARLRLPQGTPDDWRRLIDGWRELGATHISANTMEAGYTLDEHLNALRRFIETARG